jgi:hypothetical protein
VQQALGVQALTGRAWRTAAQTFVLRGAEEALHARQMCPPCAAPAPIPPAPASDWLLRLPNRPSIRVVPITCCPPWGLQDRPLGASWRAGILKSY